MDILDQIDQKIEDKEKELAELRSARVVFARELLDSSTEQKEVSVPNRLGDTGVIDLDDLGLPTKPASRKNTLRETIKDLITRFDKKEFTVSHVYAALKQMGKVTTDAKHYKNRVSKEIKNLVAEGVIDRTHEGKGNDPHKYREATQVRVVKFSE